MTKALQDAGISYKEVEQAVAGYAYGNFNDVYAEVHM